MCSSPPKPAPIPETKPRYLSNPFLDDSNSDTATARALRIGRNSLRIPLGTGLAIGFSGREGSVGTGARTVSGGMPLDVDTPGSVGGAGGIPSGRRGAGGGGRRPGGSPFRLR